MATRTHTPNSFTALGSERSVLFQHSRERFQQNHSISSQGPPVDIVTIEGNTCVITDLASPRYLPKSCQSGLYPAIAIEKRTVLLHLSRHNRPWPHKTHLSGQHIP